MELLEINWTGTAITAALIVPVYLVARKCIVMHLCGKQWYLWIYIDIILSCIISLCNTLEANLKSSFQWKQMLSKKIKKKNWWFDDGNSGLNILVLILTYLEGTRWIQWLLVTWFLMPPAAMVSTMQDRFALVFHQEFHLMIRIVPIRRNNMIFWYILSFSMSWVIQ